ncbi:sigma-70 family RNA polymerase sigma factor [Sutcliffiella horikoshii]|uniref:sigma-70 family RNA polymerase sigma factor n=1 Tax=Sutcliffiella horikoshii TaxID=79883 RepID=UPI003CFB2E9E
MDELIKEYQQSLKEVRNLQENADEKDKQIISGMIRDLEFAITWMKTSKRPGSKRGIERRGVYQNTKLLDPLMMQKYFRSEETCYCWDEAPKEHVISTGDKQRIEDALSLLTEKEKEIYLMCKGHSLGYAKIAKQLGIKKTTVQTIIKRCERKLTQHRMQIKELNQS